MLNGPETGRIRTPQELSDTLIIGERKSPHGNRLVKNDQGVFVWAPDGSWLLQIKNGQLKCSDFLQIEPSVQALSEDDRRNPETLADTFLNQEFGV
jgi:hypothetical protein